MNFHEAISIVAETYKNHIYTVITSDGDNKMGNFRYIDNSTDKIFFENTNIRVACRPSIIVSVVFDSNIREPHTVQELLDQIEYELNRGIEYFNVHFLGKDQWLELTLMFQVQPLNLID
ncbi:hypothetical protein D3C75_533730 [compost metagenome]